MPISRSAQALTVAHGGPRRGGTDEKLQVDSATSTAPYAAAAVFSSDFVQSTISQQRPLARYMPASK